MLIESKTGKRAHNVGVMIAMGNTAIDTKQFVTVCKQFAVNSLRVSFVNFTIPVRVRRGIFSKFSSKSATILFLQI